jgi:transcriptional regulator with XRE-family HTH domain
LNLGNRLREEQQRQGLSSVELARRVNKAPQHISRWRKQTDMRVSTAMAISEALGMSLSEFVEEKSPR